MHYLILRILSSPQPYLLSRNVTTGRMAVSVITGQLYRKRFQVNSHSSCHHLGHSIQSSLRKFLHHSQSLSIWIIISLVNKWLLFPSSQSFPSFNSIPILREDYSMNLFLSRLHHVFMISYLLNSKATSLHI